MLGLTMYALWKMNRKHCQKRLNVKINKNEMAIVIVNEHESADSQNTGICTEKSNQN